MKKQLLAVAVLCIMLFVFAGLAGAAEMNKGMMMENSKMMMDNGKIMMDKGKMMTSNGMKTEGMLMYRDGRLLMRHGKAMKEAAESGKMMMREHYTPEKDFKGWQETDTGG
jgi:hypothetical protein